MPQDRGEYTGFGKTMKKLMVDRSIASWMALSRRIKETTGETYSHQLISKYAYGKSEVPSEFVQDLAETLKVTKAERDELANAYTWHSRPPTMRQVMMA